MSAALSVLLWGLACGLICVLFQWTSLFRLIGLGDSSVFVPLGVATGAVFTDWMRRNGWHTLRILVSIRLLTALAVVLVASSSHGAPQTPFFGAASTTALMSLIVLSFSSFARGDGRREVSTLALTTTVGWLAIVLVFGGADLASRNPDQGELTDALVRFGWLVALPVVFASRAPRRWTSEVQ